MSEDCLDAFNTLMEFIITRNAHQTALIKSGLLAAEKILESLSVSFREKWVEMVVLLRALADIAVMAESTTEEERRLDIQRRCVNNIQAILKKNEKLTKDWRITATGIYALARIIEHCSSGYGDGGTSSDIVEMAFGGTETAHGRYTLMSFFEYKKFTKDSWRIRETCAEVCIGLSLLELENETMQKAIIGHLLRVQMDSNRKVKNIMRDCGSILAVKQMQREFMMGGESGESGMGFGLDHLMDTLGSHLKKRLLEAFESGKESMSEEFSAQNKSLTEIQKHLRNQTDAFGAIKGYLKDKSKRDEVLKNLQSEIDDLRLLMAETDEKSDENAMRRLNDLRKLQLEMRKFGQRQSEMSEKQTLFAEAFLETLEVQCEFVVKRVEKESTAQRRALVEMQSHLKSQSDMFGAIHEYLGKAQKRDAVLAHLGSEIDDLKEIMAETEEKRENDELRRLRDLQQMRQEIMRIGHGQSELRVMQQEFQANFMELMDEHCESQANLMQSTVAQVELSAKILGTNVSEMTDVVKAHIKRFDLWSDRIESRFMAEFDELKTGQHAILNQLAQVKALLKSNEVLPKSVWIEKLRGLSLTEIGDAPDVSRGLHAYVPLKCTEEQIEEKELQLTLTKDPKGVLKDLTETVERFCEESFGAEEKSAEETRVLLLQGGAGSGKSLFSRFLEQRLWERFDSEKRLIPVWVSLPKTVDGSMEKANLLDERLDRVGFNDETLAEMKKCSEQMVVILDSYDEINTKLDFKSKVFEEWPNATFIVTSRTGWLSSEKEIIEDFGTTSAVEKLFIAPFSEGLLEDFIGKFAQSKQLNEFKWTFEMFRDAFVRFNGLNELSQSPFGAVMVCTSLPHIVQKYQGRGSSFTVSRNQLYQSFETLMFEKALAKRGLTGIGHYEKRDLRHRVNKLAQLLSLALFKSKKTVAVEPMEYHGDSEWWQFFSTDSIEKLKLGPFYFVGTEKIVFTHKTFMEKGVADGIVFEIMFKERFEDFITHFEESLKRKSPFHISEIALGSAEGEGVRVFAGGRLSSSFREWKELLKRLNWLFQNENSSERIKENCAFTINDGFFLAVQNEDLPVIKAIAESPCFDPNRKGLQSAHTALTWAVFNQKTKVIGVLLDLNIGDGSFFGTSKEATLHLACKDGNTALVEILMQNAEIDVNGMQNGFAPIHIAVLHNHCDIVDLFCSNEKVELNKPATMD